MIFLSIPMDREYKTQSIITLGLFHRKRGKEGKGEKNETDRKNRLQDGADGISGGVAFFALSGTGDFASGIGNPTHPTGA